MKFIPKTFFKLQNAVKMLLEVRDLHFGLGSHFVLFPLLIKHGFDQAE